MNAENRKIRRHILFYGRVQGVGFRWYCTNFANAHGLTGWVRNLYDGSVEAEIQGTEEQIAMLIAYMEGRNFVVIEDMDVHDIPLEKSEWGFSER